MTSKGRLDLKIIHYTNLPDDHTVYLWLSIGPSDVGYACNAVDSVCAIDTRITYNWIHHGLAVLTVVLTEPVRSTRNFVRSLTRKLSVALSEEEAWACYDEALSAYPNPDEICLCGHNASDHLAEFDLCTQCGCGYFNQTLEEWYQPTQVWYTDSPGGHNGFE